MISQRYLALNGGMEWVIVATSHLCQSRRSRPHPAKGPENHVFAIMISQNSQKKRRHAATIDACAITRSPQITHFVFRMREGRRGFRRNFFLPVSADSFLPVIRRNSFSPWARTSSCTVVGERRGVDAYCSSKSAAYPKVR
jgi:hypothetical protein